MKYINKKLLVIIFSGFILINPSSCKNNELTTITTSVKLTQNINNNKIIEYDNNISNSTNDITKLKSNDNLDNDITYSNSNINDKHAEINSEDKIIEYFKDLKDKITKYVNEENFNKAKDKINDVFITVVDFIFYEKEINGVTFNALSDNAKEQVLKIAKEIDSIIIKKHPNYQIIIKGKVENAKNYINDKIDTAKDYIKDVIGEDNYNLIKDKFNDTKESISKTKDKTLTKVKKWYEKKRNNN